MTTLNAKIKLRRDTASNWATENPVLLAGEVGIETDTLKAKIGDGSTAWNSLGYAWETVADSRPASNGNYIQASNTVAQNLGALDTQVKTNADDIALKAPLASPALTGTPTAPTQGASNNSTRIATTAFVTRAVKVPADKLDKLISILDGQIYDYETDSTPAYTKTVPAGAVEHANLDALGGRTLVWNQLVDDQHTLDNMSSHGITITVSGNKYVFSGTTDGGANYYFSRLAGFSLFAGHKYLLWGVNRLNGGTVIVYDSANSTTLTQFTHNESVNARGEMFTVNTTTSSINVYYNISGANVSVDTEVEPMLIDLTLLYGAGNEPSTVSEFQQTFPADYYAFNQGTLLSADVTSMVSVSPNMLSSVTLEQGGISTADGTNTSSTTRVRTAGYISVKPNKKYDISVASGLQILNIYEYKNDNTYITYTSEQLQSLSFTTSPTTEKLRIVFRFSDDSTIVPTDVTGQYMGVISTYSVPADIQALAGYGTSAGDMFNYIDFDRKVFVQRVGAVDLGTVGWSWYSSYFRSNTYSALKQNTNKVISSVYPYGSGDKNIETASSAKRFIIRDSSYNQDAGALTTALNGVYAYFELATPTEVDISAYLTDDTIAVESGGTLTMVNSHGDDYRISVPNTETFLIDLEYALDH